MFEDVYLIVNLIPIGDALATLGASKPTIDQEEQRQ